MRETIIIRRRATPRQITLPNEETFAVTSETTSRRNLPRNVIDEQGEQEQEYTET